MGFSGTPSGFLDGRLNDRLELWDDLDGKPGVFVATATVRPGSVIPTELIARFSTEVYLDPSRKQWLVWRAAAEATWEIAIGQTPLLGEPARLARAESDALGYTDLVKASSGAAWVDVPALTAPSLAFSLGVHPWQVLHKECRRVACKLQYLYYLRQIGTPGSIEVFQGEDGEVPVGPEALWWLENMRLTAGEAWLEDPERQFPTPYQSPFVYRASCAEAEAASMITNYVYPFVIEYPPGVFTHTGAVPLFGVKEFHRTVPGDQSSFNMAYFAYAFAGKAGFNLSDVKNREVYGRSAILSPRLGVVRVLSIVDGGSGHVIGETLSVSGERLDSSAELRVAAVGAAGEVTAVSIISPGSFVLPVTDYTTGGISLTLSCGVTSVAVLDGGEGYVSSDLSIVEVGTAGVPAVYFVRVGAEGSAFRVLAVEIVSPGLDYSGLPSISLTGAGIPDASCSLVHGCINDGSSYFALHLGRRVGLPAKGFIKISAVATNPDVGSQPYGPNFDTPIATGDPRMKTPLPPVPVSVPPSFQYFGQYSTVNRYVTPAVGAASPNYDLPCPNELGTTGSLWTLTHVTVIVNRAGSWRY